MERVLLENGSIVSVSSGEICKAPEDYVAANKKLTFDLRHMTSQFNQQKIENEYLVKECLQLREAITELQKKVKSASVPTQDSSAAPAKQSSVSEFLKSVKK